MKKFVFAALFVFGCTGKRTHPAPSDAGLEDAPSWAGGGSDASPRPGMAWIPPGTLIAGTPSDRMPRVADEEMAGEQVVMTGFYIDVHPFPNEPGAIPTTNVSQAEAEASCVAQDKRLCTELEWERACKGPQNSTYEYGDTYRASVCATGVNRNLVPTGMNAGCRSAFGVHDLHGGIWEWTASAWKRDSTKTNLVTTRGGNGAQGELIGRCANGRATRADMHRGDIGFRCCAGEVNSFEVVLNVTRGTPLLYLPNDTKTGTTLEPLAPDDIRDEAKKYDPDKRFVVKRVWTWHPLGNEELILGGGCAKGRTQARCGVIVVRMRSEAPTSMGFVSSERWQPTIGEADSARELYVYGGDDAGAFRRRLSYEWGKIGIGEKTRKKKRKGIKEPQW